MKAFEEHWELTGYSEHVYYVPDAELPEQFLVDGINRKEERRQGWRAALVRVLDECRHYKNQEVIDWIIRELKE